MAALDLRASDPYGMRRGKDAAEAWPEFWPQPMRGEDWSLTKEEEVCFLCGFSSLALLSLLRTRVVSHWSNI